MSPFKKFQKSGKLQIREKSQRLCAFPLPVYTPSRNFPLVSPKTQKKCENKAKLFSVIAFSARSGVISLLQEPSLFLSLMSFYLIITPKAVDYFCAMTFCCSLPFLVFTRKAFLRLNQSDSHHFVTHKRSRRRNHKCKNERTTKESPLVVCYHSNTQNENKLI